MLNTGTFNAMCVFYLYNFERKKEAKFEYREASP